MLGAMAGAVTASGAPTVAVPHAPPMLLAQAASPEVTFWESVRDSDDPAELEAYLKAYPDGQFAPLARIRLQGLRQPDVPPAGTASEKAESPPKVPQPQSRVPPQGRLGQQSISVKLGQLADSKHGWLGVRLAELSENLAKVFGFANARGGFVIEVLPNTAAALGGMKPLDLIVEFDGRSVPRWNALLSMISATPPGSDVRIDVQRVATSFAELSDRLRTEAEKGDATAAYGLGWLYAMGAGTAKDEAEAVRLYRKAADKGLPEAMSQLAGMYANGQGVGKDEREAVAWYRKGAEKNDAKALFNLGLMYESGRGVGKDAAEAARFYRKAADQGQFAAMFRLGMLYANGNGVSKDDAEAVIWYRKAAEFDHPDAIANLGLMYEAGRGVFSDDAQAVRHYRKAAELGQIAAMHMLANMYLNGRGVAQDNAVAVSWYRRAANLGFANAMAALGWMYQSGSGVGKDEAEAMRWYRKAADLNHNGAMRQLGWLMQNGGEAVKDPAQAVSWFHKSVEAGNVDALYDLGRAYAIGAGVKEDASKGADWMFKALKAHNAYAAREMTTNAEAWSKSFQRELQRRMRDAGVYDGKVDGDFGPSTKAAIEELAKAPVSGAASANTASATFEYDVDRPGSDYRTFELESADPALCASQCGKEPKCKAWTFVKPGVQGPSARCWLKDRVPQPVTASFAVSGVRADAQ